MNRGQGPHLKVDTKTTNQIIACPIREKIKAIEFKTYFRGGFILEGNQIARASEIKEIQTTRTSAGTLAISGQERKPDTITAPTATADLGHILESICQ